MKNKKKGLFVTIKESMAKTGGCCGPGETCGEIEEKKKTTVKNTKDSDKIKKK